MAAKLKVVRVLTYEGTKEELRKHLDQRFVREHYEGGPIITEYYAEERQLERIAFTPLGEMLGGEKL